MSERQSVRLGQHGDGAYLYEVLQGLHEAVTGVAMLGKLPDPEIIFEEHGTGQTCAYFELRPDVELNPALGPTEPQPELAKRVNDEDQRVALRAITGAFAIERADNVNTMIAALRSDLATTAGGAWIVRVTWRLQRRMAMIRVLHAAHAQPDRPLAAIAEESHPLEDHTAGGDIIGKHFYDPIMLLPSPYALGVVGMRPVKEASETYLLVLSFGPDKGVRLEDAEVVWADLFETWTPYQRRGGAGLPWIKKVNSPGALINTDLLLEWWTRSLNILLTEATDLGRYRLADGLFDARNAYRELRTLDRIFVNCARIQSRPMDHTTRVGVAFEFFDLLPNILDRDVTPSEVWRALLNPARAEVILTACGSAKADR